MRALPDPRLEVTPPRPIVGWLAHAEVLDQRPAPGGGWRLRLRSEEQREVAVNYDLGGERRLPLTAGQAIRVRYYPPRPKGDPRSAALVFATADGHALAVIVRHGGLPAGVLPGGARISVARSTERLAYTEVRQRPSLCVARIAHYALRLSTDERISFVPPGASRRVNLVGTPFDLTAYDAAVAQGGRCATDAPVNLSYALIVAPPAPPDPPPAPRAGGEGPPRRGEDL